MPKKKRDVPSARKEAKLPPTAFSNACNDIKGVCHARGWEDSDEWKLFIAGAAYAAKRSAALGDELVDELKRMSSG